MLDRKKLQRYRELAQLLLKYGRRDFIDAASAEIGADAALDEPAAEGTHTPEELVRDLSSMGPTYVKLAQMLSTRSDLLAQPYLDALATLQDNVDGLGFDTIREIVERELDAPLSDSFEHFESEPLAAASLGQVHRAVMPGGAAVAVKVQRPGVREQILDDLDVFDTLASAVDRHTDLGRQYGFSDLVAQFRKALLDELDYRQEARNLESIRAELESFERIEVPRPVPELTTSKVLTMSLVRGRSVSSLGDDYTAGPEMRPLVTALCEAYLHQILVAGTFHCDPHPGNLLLTDEGHLALIDLGMVGHVDPELRMHLLRLLLALGDGRGRETAERILEFSQRLPDADIPRLVEQVSDVVIRRRHQSDDRRKLGRTVLSIVAILGANGVRAPSEVALLGKTLLLLDEVVHSLDPTFNPDDVIERYAHGVMQRQLFDKLNPSQAFSKVLDAQNFVERLPRRVNALLDSIANGEWRLKVDTIDEASLLDALERVGNRIALGLVLAALIVGAALVMQVESTFTLFGYPALAIVLFLAAVLLGFGMVLHIMLSGRRPTKRR